MKHILVVDDEQDILTCLDEALRAEGYRVSAAVSGFEALDMMATEVPDLLILDLRMPGMSGIEMLRTLRQRHARLPVVVCTALSSYRRDFDVLDANVSAFLDKPLDLGQLVATVRGVLGEDEDAGAG